MCDLAENNIITTLEKVTAEVKWHSWGRKKSLSYLIHLTLFCTEYNFVKNKEQKEEKKSLKHLNPRMGQDCAFDR